jgi:hypothetical protein
MIYLASCAPEKYAGLINDFNRDYLFRTSTSIGPVSFLRSSSMPSHKQRKHYPYERLIPAYEKLKALPKAERFLKPGNLRAPECTGYTALDFLWMGSAR